MLDRSGRSAEERYRVVRRKNRHFGDDDQKSGCQRPTIRYLVPEAVEQIIRREKLYQEANQSNQKS